jgi:hypothetical protein
VRPRINLDAAQNRRISCARRERGSLLFRSSCILVALQIELPLKDCFINAKDINILLGREKLFPQRLQNSGCSWKNKHQKDNMDVCSPRGLEQANMGQRTGVRTEDMKHIHHNAKFIDQGCIKTTEECGIFQILR